MNLDNDGTINGSVVGRVDEPTKEDVQLGKRGRIKALVIGGSVGVAFLIIGGLLAVFLGRNGEEETYIKESTKVAIFVAPITAETKINGEIYKNGLYEMDPGEYTIEITASGYKPRVYKYTVKPNRVSLLYDYLDKTEGGLSENDVDILRFLMNDNETKKRVEDYLEALPKDYTFPSVTRSPLRGIDKLREFYGATLTDYSYQLIKETLSAYFYLAINGTRNARIDDESFSELSSKEDFIETAEFKVVADNNKTFRVLIEAVDLSNNSGVVESEVYQVTVLTEAGTALFQYNGVFTKY